MDVILRIIIAVVFGFSFLTAVHYGLYRFIIRFFSIKSPSAKKILLLMLSFLAVSFVFSWTAASFCENFFTRTLYVVFGFWLGMLLNFGLAAFLTWLIFLLLRIFQPGKVFSRKIGAVLILAAIAFSFYGAWDAFNIQSKNITVKIKGLPEAWKNKTAVLISDTHLGFVHRENFLREVVEKINEIHPDIVFITGDLFDGTASDDLSLLVKPLKDINAPDGVFFITGNHEIYLGWDRAIAAFIGTGVRLLNDETIEIDGVQITGIGYLGFGRPGSLKTALGEQKNFDPMKPNILLYHTPTEISDAKESGIDLQLSGHTHNGQIFPIKFISKMVYQGYEYGLYEEGGYSIYTTSGVGTWGPMMRTGAKPEIVRISFSEK